MNNRTAGFLVAFATIFATPLMAADPAPGQLDLASPNGQICVTFRLGERREPHCDLRFGTQPLVSIELGLQLAASPSLQENLKVVSATKSHQDQTYPIAVGKASQARDHFEELVVSLEEANNQTRRVDIAIRAYDDGVAFQYRIPEQDSIHDFVLVDELTRITFSSDPTARILPLNSYTSSYEKYYVTQPVRGIAAQTLIGLPMLVKFATNASHAVWLAITEANLDNYAGLYLASVDGQPGTLAARLSPLPNRSDAAKVVGKAPFKSPWRVLLIAENAGRLLESNLIFNLNEPSRIEDTSWIRPGKTTFPWWNGYVLEGVDFQAGLNTATHKHYIDFSADHRIPYHSLDGTDTAWYGGPIVPQGKVDITKAVPEIDLPELLRYAQEKGVRLRLWMHWQALRRQIDEALPLYEKWGIEGIMVDFMDRDDQEMIAFYHEVAAKAARHKLTVTWHGVCKPTGMERTWPNVLSYEAALNQEYNKWDERGTPPQHNLDIACIRMLAGPLDYHQGGMRSVMPNKFKPQNLAPSVQGTRAHQLAMYVVYQNHLPMLVDYPAAYRGQVGLDFLSDVPANWDETHVLDIELGENLVIARRKGRAWYIGGMSARNPKSLQLPLTFLDQGNYAADLYSDSIDDSDTADEDPCAVELTHPILSAAATLSITMQGGGGFACKLTP